MLKGKRPKDIKTLVVRKMVEQIKKSFHFVSYSFTQVLPAGKHILSITKKKKPLQKKKKTPNTKKSKRT